MKLTVRNLQGGDFGNYRCISKNSLGETEGSIRLYGKRLPDWNKVADWRLVSAHHAYFLFKFLILGPIFILLALLVSWFDTHTAEFILGSSQYKAR